MMQTPAVNLRLRVILGSGMPKCGGVLAVVKAEPFGWPAASLDHGCGRHCWAAVPEPQGLGGGGSSGGWWRAGS